MPSFRLIFRLLFFLLLFSYTQPVFAAGKKSYEAVRKTLKSKAQNGSLLQFTKELHKEEFVTLKDWYRTLNMVERIAADQNLADYPTICLTISGQLYNHGDYNIEYYYLYKTQEYLLKNPVADKALNSEVHRMLGEAYFWFQRYDEARKQLLITNSWRNLPSGTRINVLNTLGLINRDQQYLDSSAIYYRKALDLAERTGNKPWIGILSGNLGYYYWQKGAYRKARPLLEKDLYISRENHQEGSAFRALGCLIEIDLKQQRITEASKKLVQLEQMFHAEENPDNARVFYTTKTAVLKESGDYKNALMNYQKMLGYADFMRRKHDMENIRKTEFRINFELKQAEVELLKEKRERSKIILVGVIVITLLLCIIFFISHRSIQRKRKRDQELMQLRQAQFTFELQATETKMRGILSKLIEKNQVVEQLTEEVERFQASEQNALSKNQVKLWDKLQSITILTDDDWLEFKRLFEKLNPGFFQRIKTHLPDLTNAELRLTSLIKLNLSIIEIARVLGISPDSVRKTSLRLRKKLDFEQHEDLVRFVSAN